MKICVIGYSASGKSTFSQNIQKIYNLPLLHIDTIFFKDGWQSREESLVHQDINDFIRQDDWLLDGNYQRFASERYDIADVIYIFDFNRFKCFYGAILRRIKYHKKQRSSAAPGCYEKLDFEFIKWLIYKGRKKNKVLLDFVKTNYPQKVILFKKRGQVNKHLIQLSKN
jgi:adenylate kinase family enzyme